MWDTNTLRGVLFSLIKPMNWFKFIFPRFVYTVSILTFYTFAICNTVDLYSYNYSKHLVRQLPGTCEWNDHPIYLLHACYVEQRHTHIVNKCLFFTFILHISYNQLASWSEWFRGYKLLSEDKILYWKISCRISNWLKINEQELKIQYYWMK